MTIIKYKNQFPSLLNTIINNEVEDWAHKNHTVTGATLPSVNIKENNKAFTVEVAAPGFDKKDFTIELNNNLLTISSEKQYENEIKEDEHFSKREFNYQSFTRSFTLPKLVESDTITATYKNGILSINIPKKEEVKPKPAKRISVS